MKTIALTMVALIFMSSACAEGDIGLFGRAVSLGAGMVAKTAGQAASETSEKRADQDAKNAAAIRQRAKARMDALRDVEEKSFEAARTGER